MDDIFRLAVVRAGKSGTIVVEQGGKLLPLDAVLGPELTERFGGNPTDLMPVLEDWATWAPILSRRIAASSDLFANQGIPASDAHFLPPISAPGKLVCIGANYHDHIAEMAIPMTPTYPYSFLKPANNTLRGSGEPVSVPAISHMMDWEAELAIVIGRKCRDVSAADALTVVAGYANFNDLSARDWLASRPAIGVDWVQHKAFDGFAPIGPYLLPAQFVDDPQDLAVRLSVNGVVKQDSSTKQMVFGVAEIIEHLTSIMTLFPGDIIATGTPAGVGQGHKPPEYLKAGDEVCVEIGALGKLVTPIS